MARARLWAATAGGLFSQLLGVLLLISTIKNGHRKLLFVTGVLSRGLGSLTLLGCAFGHSHIRPNSQPDRVGH